MISGFDKRRLSLSNCLKTYNNKHATLKTHNINTKHKIFIVVSKALHHFFLNELGPSKTKLNTKWETKKHISHSCSHRANHPMLFDWNPVFLSCAYCNNRSKGCIFHDLLCNTCFSHSSNKQSFILDPDFLSLHLVDCSGS